MLINTQEKRPALNAFKGAIFICAPMGVSMHPQFSRCLHTQPRDGENRRRIVTRATKERAYTAPSYEINKVTEMNDLNHQEILKKLKM